MKYQVPLYIIASWFLWHRAPRTPGCLGLALSTWLNLCTSRLDKTPAKPSGCQTLIWQNSADQRNSRDPRPQNLQPQSSSRNVALPGLSSCREAGVGSSSQTLRIPDRVPGRFSSKSYNAAGFERIRQLSRICLRDPKRAKDLCSVLSGPARLQVPWPPAASGLRYVVWATVES